MESQSWLCRGDFDRERLLDMDRRVAPVRRKGMAILGLALIASGPWLGWWTLGPLVVAVVMFPPAEKKAERSPRPEYWMFAVWAATQVILGACVALTGGPTVPTMAWFAIPIVTLTSRFSHRAIWIGLGWSLLVMFTVAFGVDAQAVLRNPVLVFAPLALMLSVAIMSMALTQSDIEHRGEAVIDRLTGMLNRRALNNRVAELTQQAEVNRQPIGLILGDLDYFKEVNDVHGHQTGDAVLQDVAYLLRKRLRAYDLAYRLGGEEFLVMVPGADLERTFDIAEQLREAVAGETVGGLNVTMSFGVSACVAGHFDYDALVAEADRALYQAKHSGRNCVSSGAEVAAVAVSSVAAPALAS